MVTFFIANESKNRLKMNSINRNAIIRKIMINEVTAMITINNETIATIPTLHVVKVDLQDNKIPTIFFLHGYTSAKEHNLHVAYLLAEKGFRVFLPDALHHGERETTLKGNKRDFSFWEIVLTSIKELDEMKTILTQREIVDENRIGVIGTSMGAITMYGALTAYDWIKTAVSFMGTAYYETFAKAQLLMIEEKGIQLEPNAKEKVLNQIRPYDLSAQLDKLAGRPLLIWHGKEDQVVPYPFSEKLYHELVASYEHEPEHLQFLAEDKTAHKVTRQAVLRSVEWFEGHLLTSKVSS